MHRLVINAVLVLWRRILSRRVPIADSGRQVADFVVRVAARRSAVSATARSPCRARVARQGGGPDTCPAALPGPDAEASARSRSTNATRRPPPAAHGAVLTWRAAAHDDHVMVIAAHALRSARRPMPGLLVHHVPRVPAWPVRIGMPDLLLSGLRCREKGGLGHPSPPCRCSRPAAGLASCSPRSVLARSPQKTFRPLTRSSAARSRPLMVRPRRVTTSSTWVPPPG